MQNGGAAETHEPDFGRALDEALAPLDQLIPGPRRRAEALAHARRAILAAADLALAAERRRVVQMTTPTQLRNQILALVDSHAQLLDLLDDIERCPAIAQELHRLRCRGEIRWEL
jgi:hypothetical protein